MIGKFKAAYAAFKEAKNLPTNSIFDELNERLSAPFFSSFLLSWVLYNWKITIGIWFLDKADLSFYGVPNFTEYILKYLREEVYFCWPLFWAVLYCTAWPFIQSAIKILHAAILVRANFILGQVAKDTTLKISHYLRLKNVFDKELETLKGQIENNEDNELSRLEEVQNVNDEKDKLSDDLDKLHTSLMEKDQLIERTKSSFIEGTWTIVVDESTLSYSIHIRNNLVYRIFQNKKYKRTHQIYDYGYSFENVIRFVTQSDTANERQEAVLSIQGSYLRGQIFGQSVIMNRDYSPGIDDAEVLG